MSAPEPADAAPETNTPPVPPRISELAALLARTYRYKGADDPAIGEIRQDLVVAKIEKAIAANVAKAPPLTPERLERLAAILGHAGSAAPRGGDG